MAIVIDKKIYRNIQEQVEKNKRDIAAWSNIQFTLNNFGITVLGRVDAEADIPEGTYSYGEAYLVGEEEPYDIYIYTRDGESGEFINMGPLSIVGPQGAKGDQGDAGTIKVGSVSAGEPGTNPVVTNSGTAQNAVLDFVIPRGLTGATGPQGNVGPKGETGERGPIGETGPQGDPGQSFMIIATITNTSQLPDPKQTPRNYAYVYKDGDQLTPDLIYFITGEVGSEVWSNASFAQTGTTVSVNGNPVSTFNADTKMDNPSTPGTAGQVLTSDGQGAASWQTPSGGGVVVESHTFANVAAFKAFVQNNFNKLLAIDITPTGDVEILTTQYKYPISDLTQTPTVTANYGLRVLRANYNYRFWFERLNLSTPRLYGTIYINDEWVKVTFIYSNTYFSIEAEQNEIDLTSNLVLAKGSIDLSSMISQLSIKIILTEPSV